MNEACLTHSCWLAYNMEAISRRNMEGRVQRKENSKKYYIPAPRIPSRRHSLLFSMYYGATVTLWEKL